MVGILAEDFDMVLGDFDTLEDWNKVILAYMYVIFVKDFAAVEADIEAELEVDIEVVVEVDIEVAVEADIEVVVEVDIEVVLDMVEEQAVEDIFEEMEVYKYSYVVKEVLKEEHKVVVEEKPDFDMDLEAHMYLNDGNFFLHLKDIKIGNNHF